MEANKFFILWHAQVVGRPLEFSFCWVENSVIGETSEPDTLEALLLNVLEDDVQLTFLVKFVNYIVQF